MERREVKWLIHVSIAAGIGILVGLRERTLQWLMGLFNVKCVLVGVIRPVGVLLQLISVSVTVGRFTFINLTDSTIVTYVTVATHLYLQRQVGGFTYILRAHYFIILFKNSQPEILKEVSLQLFVK